MKKRNALLLAIIAVALAFTLVPSEEPALAISSQTNGDFYIDHRASGKVFKGTMRIVPNDLTFPNDPGLPID